jgi:hypothetical protein
MWVHTKLNYDKHVERLENQKNNNEEEEWADKGKLSTLFFMKWETLILYIMLEFLNTFVIKGIDEGNEGRECKAQGEDTTNEITS